jgi:hypothetical protein
VSLSIETLSHADKSLHEQLLERAVLACPAQVGIEKQGVIEFPQFKQKVSEKLHEAQEQVEFRLGQFDKALPPADKFGDVIFEAVSNNLIPGHKQLEHGLEPRREEEPDFIDILFHLRAEFEVGAGLDRQGPDEGHGLGLPARGVCPEAVLEDVLL